MLQMKSIMIAVAALVVGAAAGWFAGGVGERGMGNGERIPLAKRVAKGDALAGVGTVVLMGNL